MGRNRSHPHQLELFEQPEELELLRQEIALLRQQMAKWQREQLSRHNDLCKEYLLLQEENELVKERLAKVERQLTQDKPAKEGSGGNYLERLFAEAYLSS